MPALAHRITLRPEMWLRRVDPSFVVGEVLDRDAGAGQRRAAARYAAAGRRQLTGRAAVRCATAVAAGATDAGRPTSRAATPAWVPTRALGRAVLLTGLLLMLGVLLGRVDLVRAGGAVRASAPRSALRRRPGRRPRSAVGADDAHLRRGRPS